MKIVYLNTSEKEANIAIFVDDKKIAEEKWEAWRELSKTLSVKYQKLLKSAKINQKELETVAVYPGPGSFTGLRIGISFANALAFGLSIPLYEADENGHIKKGPLEIIIPKYGAPPKITKPKTS